jgi:hypothetical protein
MNDKEKKPGNPWTRNLIIWIGILLGLVLFVQMIGGGSKASTGCSRRSKLSRFACGCPLTYP